MHPSDRSSSRVVQWRGRLRVEQLLPHGVPRRLGPALAVGHQGSGRAVPRGAGRRPHHQALLPGGAVDHPGRGPGPRAASGTCRTPTPGTAASPCCTAIWPRRAPSSKTAGVPEELWRFSGPAKVFESQEAAVEGILGGAGRGRRRGADPVRRAQRRPRHAGDAVPDQLPQGQGPRAGPAPWSPTGGSPAAPRGCPSATLRPRPRRAG